MKLSSKFNKGIDEKKKVLYIKKAFELIKKKDIILPLGSCFLDIFSRELARDKFNVCYDPKPNVIIHNSYQFFYGQFDNPLNLLNTLERIFLKKWKFKDTDYLFSKKFGHFINLNIKTRFKAKKLDLLKNKILEIDNYLINEIKESSLILLSFDTNEIWRDKFSKKAWYGFYGNYFTEQPFNNQAKLETLDYNNLKEIIKKIIQILSKIGKKKKFVLMVSPQQLIKTYSNKDFQIANIYNNATYISTLSDLESNNVSYFPAIEILNKINDKEKFRKDYVHVTHKVLKNKLLPFFNKLYFK